MAAVSWSACALAVSPAQAGTASVSDGFLNVLSPVLPATGDAATLLDALRSGDAAAVERLIPALGLNAVTARLLRAQLRYDLPEVHAAAIQCRDTAFLERIVPAAERCNEAAFGAALVRGDAHAMFASLEWDERVAFPALAQALGRGRPRFGNGYDHVDIATLLKSVPPLEEQLTAIRGTLPIVNWPASGGDRAKSGTSVALHAHPQVDVTINGHAVAADVDTGTWAALTVSADRAKALGIRILVRGITAAPTMNSPGSAVGNASLGLVSKFTFGPLTLRNLAVYVVPAHFVLNGIVVGLPVLARFPQVTFSRGAIEVAPASPACADAVPLTYAASDVFQRGYLVFAGVRDGKPATVMFDSGSNARLVTRAGSAGDAPAASAPPAKPRVDRVGPLAVTVGQRRVAARDAAFMSWLPAPIDVLIGAPILATDDVRLSFASPSICIDPRPAPRS